MMEHLEQSLTRAQRLTKVLELLKDDSISFSDADLIRINDLAILIGRAADDRDKPLIDALLTEAEAIGKRNAR